MLITSKTVVTNKVFYFVVNYVRMCREIVIPEYDEYSNKNTNIHLCSLPNNSFIKMKEKNSYETYKKKNS
ncbi:hypothetical protein PFUGPA_05957 [Plasmodium falciparum Palo Alto/Uganda]|uniref:Uncharacterized protein n=4 Tax=Plasmodium falciparum TaxID=5833 RepID=W4IPY5_PLAFP|nr:hypothetical protein PFFVO_00830 [Plasmodium falciparum Vietnam Oak-Knoll (FVO)]ETW44698.1 hypothetical protein PFNF135_00910 [Plasmodium falciparum NF135/5.C10]ETW52038.1 hypothetical protein PFUGPA_05957 [Plasmodium falciparum Palo Alto/Uganda]EUR78301.1 hypothetical protein PFBG_00815 [Plasmodium falciparum 7G8]